MDFALNQNIFVLEMFNFVLTYLQQIDTFF